MTPVQMIVNRAIGEGQRHFKRGKTGEAGPRKKIFADKLPYSKKKRQLNDKQT